MNAEAVYYHCNSECRGCIFKLQVSVVTVYAHGYSVCSGCIFKLLMVDVMAVYLH